MSFRSTTRWLVREPLAFFAVGGAALFALSPRATRENEVHLSERSLRTLEEAEARRQHTTTLAPRAASEVRARAIDDELLYREGLRLGVDKNDNIVRQRIIEKMLFLADDLGGAARPVSEDELARYFAVHAAEYRRPGTVSFIQVFSNAGVAPLTAIERKLAPGTTGPAAEPPSLGDPFPIGRRAVDVPLDAVSKTYGDAFARAVRALPLGVWSEPIRSSYGDHLVKVIARHDGGVPPLDEVRADVRNAYLQERKARATDELLRSIRARYRVVVDEHGDALPQGGASAGRSGAPVEKEAD